jgi:hypothetical protein
MKTESLSLNAMSLLGNHASAIALGSNNLSYTVRLFIAGDDRPRRMKHETGA